MTESALAINLDAACWLYRGPRAGAGYGQVIVNGTKQYAHRYMWTVMRGPIPPKIEIHHLCRVRLCVNPQHMQLVTRQQHMDLEGNGTKTHCPAGHEYSEANTHYWKNGERHCRICDRLRKRARHAPEAQRTYRWKS